MLLEETLRKIRAAKARKHIKRGAIVCDIGCGPSIFFLKSIRSSIAKGYGFYRKINNFKQDNLEVYNSDLEKSIDLPYNTVDTVCLLAVLEHLQHPEDILKDSHLILKNDGTVIITTPSPAAKSVLDFLAFRLGVLDKKEISEHLNYFSLDQLKKILIRLGFKIIKAEYFELGFNLFVVAQK